MKVVDVKSLVGSERDVQGEGFKSLRILLEKDNMGFGLHKTEIEKGGPYHWHYKHHLEACYCVSGWGVLKNLETDEEFTIDAGVTYILDNHDNHTFTAMTKVTLISVFNPPVTGKEIHLKDGSYSKS